MSSLHALRLLPLLLLTLILGACRTAKETEGSAAAPGASASAGASPCSAYASKLCDKAGADSPHCVAIKQLEGVLPPKACTAASGDFAYTQQKLVAERKPCTDLMERLCKDIGPDTESCRMVRARTPEFPAGKCAQMAEQYAGVLEELRKQEEKSKPLDAARQAAIVEGTRAVTGAKDAKVKVVLFSDFQCPFCSKATPTVDAIRKTYGDRVYLVFRQFPLSFHEHAHLAAQASLEAAAQGKFWEFHDKVFQNQSAIARENLEAYARDVGMDVPRLKAALDKQTHKAAVDADLALGTSVNVGGTPTLFVNGKLFQNVADAPGVVAAIDTALKQ